MPRFACQSAMVAVIALAFVSLESGFSQSASSFEVASVKQHPLASGFLRRLPTGNIQCPGIGHCGISGNRFTEDVASLNDLIMDAYKVKPYQITGLPSWGDSGRDVYDVKAKIDGNRTYPLDEVRRMLQALLADRFHLKLHHETKDLPIYALVIAKNGSKLTQATGLACPGESRGGRGGDDGAGGVGGRGDDAEFTFLRSWEHMATMLAGPAGRPVIDKTGLEGVYCTRDGQDPLMALTSALVSAGVGGGRGRRDQAPNANPDAEPGPSIFTMVEEMWGLKLEPQKGPVDILVIDHVERPSEN